MSKSYRDASKMNWVRSDESDHFTLEQINAGSFMRIADATEKMAQLHTDLIRERDFFEKECARLRNIRATLERSNAALRGHIKRIKKQGPRSGTAGMEG